MRVFVAIAVFFGIVQASLAAEFTGFIIDNFCWRRPGHVAIDGARLETRPQDHYLHCLLLSICKPDGYALLEEYDDAGTTKYRIKYQLDAAGNAKAIEFFEQQIAIRDRKFTDQVTVVGELSMDGVTITTTSLAIADMPTGAPTPLPSASPTPPTESPSEAPTLENPTMFPTTSPVLPTAEPTFNPITPGGPGGGTANNNGFIGSNGELREGFWVLIGVLLVMFVTSMVLIFRPRKSNATSPPQDNYSSQHHS